MPINVLDSRRLTGPGVLLDGPGAVLDVRMADQDVPRAIEAWRDSARRLLDAVGWSQESLVSRRFPGGVSLALTAPVDGLYSATELNERAWQAAAASLEGSPIDALEADAVALRQSIAAERNPALLALRNEARSRKVTFLAGEEMVSVGSGAGVLAWPADALPEPATVDWSAVRDIPIVLVTGSNGKTTVVRLLAEMVRESGLTPGFTSTEGVVAGSSQIGEGDFSGPSGARLVLRHNRVEIAILETARGGILRRGLAVERARVAVVTNVAEDHLGEFGIETLTQLADTKLVVAKALSGTGTLVLNADDPMLVERHPRSGGPITWFSLQRPSPFLAGHIRSGGAAVLVEEGSIVMRSAGRREVVVQLDQVPISFKGTAGHNVANALAAVAAGSGLGLELESMAATLRRFGQAPGDNPGRSQLITLGDVRVLIDYAHNPHGMLALGNLVEGLAGGRRLLMLGQAGDRSDEAIRQLARAAWSLRPDRIITKEMSEYLRGRAPGEVPALLRDELIRLGVDQKVISYAGGDLEGVRCALEWARPGDLLVLAVHQERPSIVALLNRLRERNWRAGDPLPGD